MGILKGYVNKENNSNRIYSREDVGKMSTAEYSKNEKAINHQMRTVGVPSNSDLKNSSDVIYVAAYKKADGTEVSAYYRSKSGGSGTSTTSKGNGGGVLDENPNYPWEGQDDTKNKNSKKDKEEEKVNPLNDLLNYVTTGEFNKDQFIGHVVDSVADNELFDMPEDNDPNREMLLKLVKQNNEFIDGILDGVTNLLPEDSQITDAVKGLVQYKKNMSEQMETMLDPEKAKEQMITETKQWLSDFTDFTGQLVSGDFENIKWDEVGQKLHISQIASIINPVAGVIATLAVDVAPKVVKLVEGVNAGDKAEIIQNAIGAFTNCMSVVGQLKESVGNKLAEFSKDVDAKIYNEAAQTYDNLGQLKDAGYKYETYVKAEMFDQANQEAIKLNDLSTEMMQGEPTGFASNTGNVKSSDLSSELKDNRANDYAPSNTVLQGGVSKDAYITNTNYFGDRDLNRINNFLNSKYKDARDLMNIGLDGPKNAPASKEYSFISSDFNNNLNRDLNLTGNNKIPDGWDGFVFNKDSTLSYNLSKSPELKTQIMSSYDIKNNSFPSKISVSLNDDKNLKWSIHGATIINAKMDSQGNVTGLLHDNYDYKLQDYKDDSLTNLANNSAYLLQQAKRLKNYYLLAPIKFKVNVKNKK